MTIRASVTSRMTSLHARSRSKVGRFSGDRARHRAGGRHARADAARRIAPRSPTGATVNNFWNSYTLIQTATDASFFAIMAIGATIVIISGGIDLSVGSIYALRGVSMALFLRAVGPMGGASTVLLGLLVCVGVGLPADC